MFKSPSQSAAIWNVKVQELSCCYLEDLGDSKKHCHSRESFSLIACAFSFLTMTQPLNMVRVARVSLQKKQPKRPFTVIFHPTVLMGTLCSVILPDLSPSRWLASSFLVLFICPEASLPCLSMRFMLDKQLKERAGTSKAGLLIR